MPRPRAVAVAALLAALALVPAATAKERVVARLATAIARDAAPGSRVAVTWTLTAVEDGKRYGAGYAFVRLVAADGTHSARVYGTNPARGRYRALVTVPRGGVERVQIGVMGRACSATGCRPAPRHFPLVGRVFR